MKTSSSIKLITGLLLSASFAPAAFAGQGHHQAYEPSLVPSGAQAGQCYARVQVPAQYSTTQENVLVEEGYNKVEVSQARLARRQEQVEIKQASVRYEVKQPTFRSVTEQMMVRPSYDKLSVSAPQFRTITETVQTSAPRTVWKRGNPGALRAKGYTVLSVADAGQNGNGYSSTTNYGATGGTQCGSLCEIWCLVEEPGQSTSFNRRVMTSPGEVRRTNVPAKYRSITKQVVSDPGGVREIPVPAQYRSVTVEDIVDPGGERFMTVPPKYGAVQKKTLISAERYEWRRVICNNASSYSGSSYSSNSTSYSAPSSSYGSSYGSGYSSGGSGTYSSGSSSSSSYGGGSSSYGSSSQSITYGGYGKLLWIWRRRFIVLWGGNDHT